MTYPAEVVRASPGGLVEFVVTGSPAADAGIEIGDTVTAAEGEPVRDILDWLWHADAAAVRLTVLSSEGEPREVEMRREMDEPWGLTFAGVVFDGVRECENACAFCFVSQLPEGLRPSLYVRDDDFRLSFLTGNFVTLTNLTDEDVARILGQRLSPLHVSLHAVDEDVRRRLMCVTTEDLALQRIDELLAGGIDLHVQVVLVPGVNDGAVLQRTLAWAAERPGVLSVGIVPVGYTAHQTRITSSFGRREDAHGLLAAIAPWQKRMRGDRGVGWVYGADEFYLAAGAHIPAWDEYDDFPQYENGIGMTRAFVDELAELVDDAVLAPAVRASATLVTGELFAPVLAGLAPSLATFGAEARVLRVANALFGGNVSVAGLLSGADIAAAIGADEGAGDGPYLVPDCAVNDHGAFLDDFTLDRLRDVTRKDVRLVSSDAAGLAAALSEIVSETSG